MKSVGLHIEPAQGEVLGGLGSVKVECAPGRDRVAAVALVAAGETEVGRLTNASGVAPGSHAIAADLRALGLGTHRIVARALDAVGALLAESAPRDVTVTNLRIDPLKLHAPKGLCTINVEYAPVAKDELVALLTLNLGEATLGKVKSDAGIGSGPHDVDVDFSALGDGSYEVVARCYATPVDRTPLSESAAAAVRVTGVGKGALAKAAPPFFLGSFAPTISADSRPEIRCVIQDEAGTPQTGIAWKVRAEVDGKAIKDVTVNGPRLALKPARPLADGRHAVSFFVSSPRWEKAKARFDFMLLIDTTPPSLTVDPAPLYTNALTSEFEVHAEEATTEIVPATLQVNLGVLRLEAVAETVEASGGKEPRNADAIGKGEERTLRVRVTTPLSEGAHRLALTVADRAGNRSKPIEKTVCVDTTAPVVRRRNPEPGAVIGPRGPIEAELSDESQAAASSGIATVELWIDGQTATTGMQVQGDRVRFDPPLDLADGEHVVQLVLGDRAGNQSRTEWVIRVDAIPPRISALKPAPGAWTAAPELVLSAALSDTGSGIDPGSVRIFVDGQDLSARATLTGSGFSLNLGPSEERLYSVRIECADSAGNTAEPVEYEFRVDTSPPDIHIDELLDETATIADSIVVTGSIGGASPGEVVSVEVNGAATSLGDDAGFRSAVPLSPGHNRITAQVATRTGAVVISNAVDVHRVDSTSAAFAGEVRDPGDRPLAGVVVSHTATGRSGVSNEHGRFVVPGLPDCTGVVNIDPSASIDPGLEPVRVEVRARCGTVFALPTPIYLVRSALHQGQDVPETPGCTIVTAADHPEVTVSVDNAQVEFPPGAPRRIAASAVPTDRLPVDPPAHVLAGTVALLEPSGLRIREPGGAAVSLPNDGRIVAGTILPLLTYGNERGRWELGGFARVSDDGLRVESLPGAGLRHFSLVAAAPLGPKLELLNEVVNVPGTDALKGGLETVIVLPAFQVRGREVSPELVYSSLAAAPSVTLTGVFKGLKTIRSEPEVSTERVQREGQGRQITQVDRSFVPGVPWVWERSYPPVYVPISTPALQPGVSFDEVGGNTWAVTVTAAVDVPVTFYRLDMDVTATRTSEIWPEAITSRYLFSTFDSGEFTFVGTPVKRGPEPLSGQPDERREFPALPEDLAVTYHFEPRLPSGLFYPTGLYSFLARYAIRGRGYASVQESTLVKEAFVDSGYLEFLKRSAEKLPAGHPTRAELEEAIESLQEARDAYAGGSSILRSQFAYSDPLDYLLHDDAGTAVLHNLSRSPLGRGWRLQELQQLYPLGHSHALIVGPEGKHVFTVSHTIQSLAPGAYGPVALAPDRRTIWAASPGKPGEGVTEAASVYRLDGVGVMPEQPAVMLEGLTKHERVQTFHADWINEPFICFWWPTQVFAFGFWFTWYTPIYCDNWHWTEAWLASDSSSSTTIPARIAGVAAAPSGDVFISDRNTHRIYRLPPGGQTAEVIAGRAQPVDSVASRVDAGPSWRRTITTTSSGAEPLAGFTPDGVLFAGGTLDRPGGLAVDGDGNLIFAETGSHRVRRLNFQTGCMETLAGNGDTLYLPGTAFASRASLPNPKDVAVAHNGDVYVLCDLPPEMGDDLQAVVRIDRAGFVHHLCGAPAGTIDTGVNAQLHKLVGAEYLAVDADDQVYVSVAGQNKIVVIRPDGYVDAVAGTGDAHGLPADGGPALGASIGSPLGIATTPEGNVIVADAGHESVRLVALAVGALGDIELAAPRGYFASRLVNRNDGSWERSYKDGTRVHFGADGRHLATEDRNGNRTAFDYDARDRLTRIDYPGGAFLALAYGPDASGLLAAIEDHTGRVTRFESTGGDLAAVHLPDGGRETFVYDGGGRMISRRDAAGMELDFEYNEYGRLVGAGTAGAVASIIRPEDTCAGNDATIQPRTASEVSTIVRGPEGSETALLIENGHLIREIVAPDKSKTQITYNDDLLPAVIKRPGGSLLELIYNERGDVTERRDEALQSTETYQYDANGLLVLHRDATGCERRLEHDERGNLVAEHVGSASIVTTYERDTFGQVIRQLGKGLETRYEYDALGNVTRLSLPGVADVTYGRDAAGNLLVQAQGTLSTRASYDAFNRPLEIAEADGTTRYVYDALGRLSEITDALGRKHTREYDVRGSLVRRTDAAGRVWEYESDSAGRVTAEVRPDKTRLEHQYDPAGHEIRVSAGNDQIEREYGREDRLVSAHNADSEVHNVYDESGRLVAQELRFPGDRRITVNFDYDPAGKRTAVRPAPGAAVHRRYDADTGLLTRVDCGANWWIEIERDEHGRCKTVRRGNGVETRLSYDATARLREAVSMDVAATEIHAYVTAFDAQGDCSGTGGWSFAHDASGRLAEAAQAGGDPLRFTYDAAGNRLSDTSGDYRYDSHQDLLMEDPRWSYEYDPAGRLVARISKADPTLRDRFAYSAFGRLSRFDRKDGGAEPAITARYFYDPLGRRIGKDMRLRDAPQRNETVWWVYEDDDILLELDASFNVVRQYVGTGTVDSTLGWIDHSGVFYFFKGHRGNVERVVDGDARVVASYTYEPFGRPLGISEPEVRNPYRFASREWDVESETYYFRARQYDPASGRFLQPDPHPGRINEPVTVANRYAYVGNRPLTRVDPFGLTFRWDLWLRNLLTDLDKFGRSIGEMFAELTGTRHGNATWDKKFLGDFGSVGSDLGLDALGTMLGGIFKDVLGFGVLSWYGVARLGLEAGYQEYLDLTGTRPLVLGRQEWAGIIGLSWLLAEALDENFLMVLMVVGGILRGRTGPTNLGLPSPLEVIEFLWKNGKWEFP